VIAVSKADQYRVEGRYELTNGDVQTGGVKPRSRPCHLTGNVERRKRPDPFHLLARAAGTYVARAQAAGGGVLTRTRIKMNLRRPFEARFHKHARFAGATREGRQRFHVCHAEPIAVCIAGHRTTGDPYMMEACKAGAMPAALN